MNKLNFKSTEDGIHYLLDTATEKEWSYIVESLNTARDKASESLNQNLYDSLEWPTNQQAYINYLNQFVLWIPQQSGGAAWQDPTTLHSQEVYDRLCHYYYLVDQKTSIGVLAQNIPWFSQFLVSYANLWGKFLNTPESFNSTILKSFIQFSPQYRIEDSMNDGIPNANWNTFNEFFARELNPYLRPIDNPGNNKTVVMPADCTYRKKYDIRADSTIEEIVIKQTHTYANIAQLLEGSEYAQSFSNGTFIHYFLAPYSYHRFHAPVSGVVQDCRAVQGLTFLQVEIHEDGPKKGQFNAPDDAENGYEFLQARGILTIDTTNSPDGDIGVVAVIPVGMCQVSSVHMQELSGKSINKGDEFGYFMFGGSDIIMLFQEGKQPVLNEQTSYRHYGTSTAISPSYVVAKSKWQNTNIKITSGNPATISYINGEWTANPNDNNGKLYGPNGNPNYIKAKPGYTMPNENEGALIGKVGDSIFLVGESCTIPSNLTGYLELCINDDLNGEYGAGFTDNLGIMVVQVSIG